MTPSLTRRFRGLAALSLIPLLSGCILVQSAIAPLEPRPTIKRWTLEHEGHKLECYTKKFPNAPLVKTKGHEPFLSFDGTRFLMDFDQTKPGRIPDGEVIRFPANFPREPDHYRDIYLRVPADQLGPDEFAALSAVIRERYPDILALLEEHCYGLSTGFRRRGAMERLRGTLRVP